MLEPFQFLQLQRLSKKFYKQGIAQLQPRFKLAYRFYFFSVPQDNRFSPTLFRYNAGLKQWKPLTSKVLELNLHLCKTIQVGRDSVYAFGEDKTISIFKLTCLNGHHSQIKKEQLKPIGSEGSRFALASH